LTSDQIYQPTVYWTKFGEFAGLDFQTIRKNFDLSQQYEILVEMRNTDEIETNFQKDFDCLSRNQFEALIIGMRTAGPSLNQIQFIYAGMTPTICKNCIV
jgi:hypothetical protein